MRRAARLAAVMVVGSWLTTAGQTSVAGTGGHGGGSGGHGGGHGSSGHSGGHSSRGSSSGTATGHSATHSIGHSIAHFFGHREKGDSGSSAATLAPTERNSFQQAKLNFVPRPGLHPPPHRRPPGTVVVFFPHRRHFGFGGCPSFVFPGNGWFWGNGFNCFDNGFFLDPLWFWGASGSFFYGPPSWLESGASSIDSSMPTQEAMDESSDEGTNNPAVPPVNEGASDAKNEPRVTLLQLRDGSMYGLTDYWLEGNQLHYVTTYGGQEAVPVERIDLEKTARLNADRGVGFVLKAKPRP